MKPEKIRQVKMLLDENAPLSQMSQSLEMPTRAIYTLLYRLNKQFPDMFPKEQVNPYRNAIARECYYSEKDKKNERRRKRYRENREASILLIRAHHRACKEKINSRKRKVNAFIKRIKQIQDVGYDIVKASYNRAFYRILLELEQDNLSEVLAQRDFALHVSKSIIACGLEQKVLVPKVEEVGNGAIIIEANDNSSKEQYAEFRDFLAAYFTYLRRTQSFSKV